MVYSSVTVCWCREKEWRHLEIKWRRCSYVRIIRITGILILCELLSLILFFAVSRFGDIHVVEAICLVAADAEKAIALNCLCSEVFLCFGNSVASTRFMLQDEFNLQTTKCDNCIIGFMFCLQQLACICSIIACLTGSEEIQDAAQLLNCLSDLVYCSVCSCMQHKVEMDKRDGKFGPRPMAVPPVQQMSRLDQPVPPSVGYPPAQPQAYPPMQEPHGYPPPPQQPQGYPPPQQQPQGYPPPQQQPYYPPPGAGYPQ